MAVLVVLLLAGVAIAGIIILVRLARTPCPRCRTGTLEIDEREHPGGSLPDVPDARRFRCVECREEYCRQAKGPLIPRAAWEAGARDELPRATLKQ